MKKLVSAYLLLMFGLMSAQPAPLFAFAMGNSLMQADSPQSEQQPVVEANQVTPATEPVSAVETTEVPNGFYSSALSPAVTEPETPAQTITANASDSDAEAADEIPVIHIAAPVTAGPINEFINLVNSTHETAIDHLNQFHNSLWFAYWTENGYPTDTMITSQLQLQAANYYYSQMVNQLINNSYDAQMAASSEDLPYLEYEYEAALAQLQEANNLANTGYQIYLDGLAREIRIKYVEEQNQLKEFQNGFLEDIQNSDLTDQEKANKIAALEIQFQQYFDQLDQKLAAEYEKLSMQGWHGGVAQTDFF